MNAFIAIKPVKQIVFFVIANLPKDEKDRFRILPDPDQVFFELGDRVCQLRGLFAIGLEKKKKKSYHTGQLAANLNDDVRVEYAY